MPKCEEVAIRETIGAYFMSSGEDGRVRLENLLESRYQHLLANPGEINLREITMATDIVRKAEKQDETAGIAALFTAMNDKPESIQEVLPMGEGIDK